MSIALALLLMSISLPVAPCMTPSIRPGTTWACPRDCTPACRDTIVEMPAGVGVPDLLTPDLLTIERLGGLTGFGQPRSRIRGRIPMSGLSADARSQVESLFRDKVQGMNTPATPGAFRYLITRQTPHGDETIEVPEFIVPEELRAIVRDEPL